jgi:Na+:H+ antiporter, NhaA family
MKRVPGLIKKIVLHPLKKFIADSRAVGIILICCTALSLLIANSSLSQSYFSFINFSFFSAQSNHTQIPSTVLQWINDGLMTLFFFFVSMEIKRELLDGELSNFSKAILPIIAAVGGMVVPAIIYSIINYHTPYTNGWGIPMATDIAFSLGVTSLLGKRIPIAAKIFLMALAIIDDLGAIVTIAIYYSSQLQYRYLFFAALIVAILFFLNRKKIFGIFNIALGVSLWYVVFNSGIHATIAGVLFAFTIPKNKLTVLVYQFNNVVNFFIIPIFAFANTAIVLPANFFVAINNSLSWGIVAGLCIGKPVGIIGSCYIAIKLKIASLPSYTNWPQLIGVAIIAGTGFTMSIFMASLAFDNNHLQDVAKFAVLIASIICIVVGLLWYKLFTKSLTP